MSNKDTEIRSRYEDYSVEELQKDFKSTFLSSIEFSDADIEELDQIVAVLKRKHPVPRKFTTEESWKDFLKNHSEDFARIGIQNTEEVMKEGLETVAARMSSWSAAEDTDVGANQEVTVAVKADAGASCDDRKPRKCYHKWKHTALVAAAVVMIMVLITVTAAAAGINIWSWVPVQGDGTFRFVSESAISKDIPNALKQAGIEEPLFPTWIPEGFILGEQQIYIEEPLTITAGYFCKDRILTVTIKEMMDSSKSGWAEMDDSLYCIYDFNSVRHYIFSNNGSMVATWYVDNYLMRVSGDISLEEMKLVIDSVYEVTK